MPVSLIGPGDYQAIRSAIRLDLDDTDIPDDAIETDIFAGEAEREVRALDPNVDTYTGTSFRRAKLAAIYLCAAALATALPNIAAENFSGAYSYRIEGFNPLERAAWLRWTAYEQVAANMGIEPVALMGAMAVFELAGAGPRGQERGAFPALGAPGAGIGGVLGWW